MVDISISYFVMYTVHINRKIIFKFSKILCAVHHKWRP